MSKKIVYVTGCCGFIGSYVTQACLDKGLNFEFKIYGNNI